MLLVTGNDGPQRGAIQLACQSHSVASPARLRRGVPTATQAALGLCCGHIQAFACDSAGVLTRSCVQVPSIVVHFSPARLRQLLEVVQVVYPTPAAVVDVAPWIKAAEFTGDVDVLAWAGLAGAASQWVPRHAVVYRGTLYLLESDTSSTILRQVCIRRARRDVPAGDLCLACCAALASCTLLRTTMNTVTTRCSVRCTGIRRSAGHRSARLKLPAAMA